LGQIFLTQFAIKLLFSFPFPLMYASVLPTDSDHEKYVVKLNRKPEKTSLISSIVTWTKTSSI